MLRKLRLSLLPALLLCMTFALPICAASDPLIDDADLFSESEENDLLEQINRLKSDTGMDYLVVTTDDAQGMSAQDYADNAYGSSDASKDTLLYLIDMDNREIYVYTQGMAIRYITDDRLDMMMDAAYIEVADGKYFDSAVSVLNDVEAFYKEGIEENQHNYDEVTGEVDYYEEDTEGLWIFGALIGMLIGLVIGGIAALIKSLSVKNDYNLNYDTYHYPLSDKSKLHLTVSEDRLTGKFVTHRRIPKEDSSSNDRPSGRSTVHHASSGRSHGGGGRKF